VRHSENGFRLGAWVNWQRTNKEKLRIERRERLDGLAFVWDAPEAAWEDGFSYLKGYKQREGHCRVPDDHKENGFRLGQWVGDQRVNKEKLTVERRVRLDEIGFIWDPIETAWEQGFRYLTIYKEREGHCRVPKPHKEDGFPLGQWVLTRRHNKESLSEVRQQRLDELGFVWDPFQAVWEQGFRYLIMYKEREGHCRVADDHKENGFRLGSWVRRQRHGRNTLSEVRQQRLDELGFVWDPLDAVWAEGFRYLTMYKEREAHCRVPTLHKEDGFPLGQWVVKRRHSKTLSEERREELNKLGFLWDPYEADWEEGFRYLTIYKEREGHCRVPRLHKEGGFPLGQWVGVQRRNADTMPALRRQQLDELGFVWDPLDAAWAEGVRYLTIYKEREGHCRVPTLHKEDGFPLGQWVVKRRHSKTLSEERREELNKLGFVWNVSQGRSRSGPRSP
jgi:Helicase associated domain